GMRRLLPSFTEATSPRARIRYTVARLTASASAASSTVSNSFTSIGSSSVVRVRSCWTRYTRRQKQDRKLPTDWRLRTHDAVRAHLETVVLRRAIDEGHWQHVVDMGWPQDVVNATDKADRDSSLDWIAGAIRSLEANIGRSTRRARVAEGSATTST